MTILGPFPRPRRAPSYRQSLAQLTSSPEWAQSFESLISNLQLAGDSPSRSILLTSARPAEGKTTLSVNFALSLLMVNRRTVLVDTDMRRPRLHEIFDLDEGPGFTEVLSGSVGLDEVVTRVAMDINGAPNALHVVTSGAIRRDAFAMLDLSRLARMLDDLKGRFDVVVLDSPPVLAAAESMLLAGAADSVVVVLTSGVSTVRETSRTIERLQRANGNVCGVVMNRFDPTRHGPALLPYYTYYANGRLHPDE